MSRSAWLAGAAWLAALAAACPPPASAEEALQPYQLVRSLQLMQDRIAAGDHAALPMQGKLLEMVDERLRDANDDDFKDPKNFRALLVYGMSGGNPVTVAAAISRLELDPANKAIAVGVINYLNGRPAGAKEALKPIDPMAVPPDIGAFIALVKGSLLASEEPVKALTLLDEARLLSPGTLVEEAALRRSVAIAVEQGDAARFVLASTQYVDRYLYSPYASQFADSFVSGAISLNQQVSQDKLADITSMMDPEREKVVYLRIARRAAIDGLKDMSAFASARAESGRGGVDNQEDPRALLYSSLSNVTSDKVADVDAKLRKIDRNKLSEGDRALLDAAKAVAKELVAPPAMPASHPKPGKAAGSEQARTDASGDAAGADASGLPPVEGIMSETPAAGAQPAGAQPAAAPAPPPSRTATAANDPAAHPAPAAGAPAAATASSDGAANSGAAQMATAPAAAPDQLDPNDPADATMIEARRQLDLIDQMLGAAPR